ncbi:Terminal organelle assembly protein [Senna tora]|uniref:Terminal organelle assembly protein n=1 Tax=Senna tora TaxID=362788 RepID=A0A834TMD9_9FABA|nr:Terminal organelle assembly protein [Senna tora]
MLKVIITILFSWNISDLEDSQIWGSNGIPTSVQEHLPYRLKPSASSSKFKKLIKGFSDFVQEMVSLMSQVSREEKEYSMEELQKEQDNFEEAQGSKSDIFTRKTLKLLIQ